MQSPIEMSDNICLVCLPARGSNRKPGQRCTVTGYGYVGESESYIFFIFLFKTNLTNLFNYLIDFIC